MNFHFGDFNPLPMLGDFLNPPPDFQPKLESPSLRPFLEPPPMMNWGDPSSSIGGGWGDPFPDPFLGGGFGDRQDNSRLQPSSDNQIRDRVSEL